MSVFKGVEEGIFVKPTKGCFLSWEPLCTNEEMKISLRPQDWSSVETCKSISAFKSIPSAFATVFPSIRHSRSLINRLAFAVGDNLDARINPTSRVLDWQFLSLLTSRPTNKTLPVYLFFLSLLLLIPFELNYIVNYGTPSKQQQGRRGCDKGIGYCGDQRNEF